MAGYPDNTPMHQFRREAWHFGDPDLCFVSPRLYDRMLAQYFTHEPAPARGAVIIDKIIVCELSEQLRQQLRNPLDKADMPFYFMWFHEKRPEYVQPKEVIRTVVIEKGPPRQPPKVARKKRPLWPQSLNSMQLSSWSTSG